MKNYKIYSLIIFLSLACTSCKKYLDRTPGIALDEDKVFSDPVQAARFADNAYNYLINDYVRFNDHRGCTSQASDEAVSGNSEYTVTTLNRGLYFDHSTAAYLNDIGDVWANMYAGIAVTNKMLDKIGGVPAATIFPAQRVEGEMHFLRAFFYFELVKRFGGVPLLVKPYGVNDDVNLPRASYDACITQIVADADKAFTLLGNDADYTASNYGRATKGAALALKARTLLYAASPLNNTTNDKTKWKAAADAAKAVMDLNQYALQDTYADMLNFTPTPDLAKKEYIMYKVRGPRAIDGMFADFSMSPSSGGAQGQMDPTQNHVDMYQMQATGKDITDPTSGYDPQNPYAGRDPRFYANILYNGQTWQGKTMDTWIQTDGTGKVTAKGKDIDPSAITYTATSYYCKKYWPETYNRVGGGTTLLNYIYFRYAEVLLNYAEAQNEYLDAPDASVYAAINAIRQRPAVNMPVLPAGLSKDQMRVAIRHERAIELAFEDHRWYDIMRWHNGPATINVPIYGMKVIKNTNGSFTYTPTLLGATFQKTYTEQQHRYPIPRSEIYKSKGVLVQNPGWN
ncbi:RagB/SusD family nutrient uptake outer membrane protein [Mucilaginibacter mali]|uniref:RagB/SusD family nutrient uptake outer membrane protein n=1 Tax=Mucilaginibacter mali TaxID=2740462 RepID=A0A7D4ULH1_9SPHI|nr:RagB/SusD family nutrient uptake outer membrane protein [Mucilaginibacter mali]QKJ29901.1 RagB/SusD family nutrient uptake outer membrane protein [Mucilaginibacter mali]